MSGVQETRTRERPPALRVTDAAAAQLRRLMERHNPDAAGIRVGVRDSGCSGMAYTMDFVDEKSPMDEAIDAGGVTVFVDPMAIMYLIGTEMDYVEANLGANFVFRNPNETGRCGCGESFSANPADTGTASAQR
jgi:iron-sulfur cluster assembly protein